MRAQLSRRKLQLRIMLLLVIIRVNRKSKPQLRTMLLVIIQVVLWNVFREIESASRKELTPRYVKYTPFLFL